MMGPIPFLARVFDLRYGFDVGLKTQKKLCKRIWIRLLASAGSLDQSIQGIEQISGLLGLNNKDRVG